MKKNIVLFVLFVLPIVAYLFFASGVNGYTNLPIITKSVPDFGKWKSVNNEKISLNNKVTILGFTGKDIIKNRGNLFNLNQKIYQPYYQFADLQFVMICPNGTESDIATIMNAIDDFTDVSNWHFLYTDTKSIESYYQSLQLKQDKLGADYGTPNVYIIDKSRNLRGRKDADDYKEGYNTFHPSELSNSMLDDFKVILYEYRAAMKKNNNATRQL